MDDEPRAPPSHFFTLRLWPEEAEDSEPVWRGRVQDTASGEVRYFQGWKALMEVLRRIVDDESPLGE